MLSKEKQKNILNLGQIFTPDFVVNKMLSLRKNFGNILEPSCGNGAFLKNLGKNSIGIEIDFNFRGRNIINKDFFDYSESKKFDTIIGNPPYVRFQDIPEETKRKLNLRNFDKRSNLYLFFIEKSIKHLKPNGELIFITPRDFLKATSSIKLNEFIFNNGTITDMIDLGDKKIFNNFTPNCIIWRFQKDNFSRKTSSFKNFVFLDGQLLFINNKYSVKFNDLFFVKVGAVSGADNIFENEKYGNADFVCSYTAKTGKTKRMIYDKRIKYLEKFKDILLKRRINNFNENNWWKWGRKFFDSNQKRIYVNGKTRNKKPFFLHNSKFYDGSVLAIFPKFKNINLKMICDDLNKVNWQELGFVCDNRFLFSQKSLENCILPDIFRKYLGG